MELPPKRASGWGNAPQPHSTLVEQGVWVSRHALDRVREHHPNAGVRGALALLARADEVAAGFIAPFLDRRLEDVRDRYLIAADRKGCFVIVRAGGSGRLPWTMITYLRFDAHQEDVASRLLDPWPDIYSATSDPAVLSVCITPGTRSAA